MSISFSIRQTRRIQKANEFPTSQPERTRRIMLVSGLQIKQRRM
jgi:hypothetical protein